MSGFVQFDTVEVEELGRWCRCAAIIRRRVLVAIERVDAKAEVCRFVRERVDEVLFDRERQLNIEDKLVFSTGIISIQCLHSGAMTGVGGTLGVACIERRIGTVSNQQMLWVGEFAAFWEDDLDTDHWIIIGIYNG